MTIESIGALAGIISTVILIASILTKREPHNLLTRSAKSNQPESNANSQRKVARYSIGVLSALMWGGICGTFLYMAVINNEVNGDPWFAFFLGAIFPGAFVFAITSFALRRKDSIKILVAGFITMLAILSVYVAFFDASNAKGAFWIVGFTLFWGPITGGWAVDRANRQLKNDPQKTRAS